MMCCILSQLNIICSSLVKPDYTKMTIQPLSTFYVFQRTGFHRSKVTHVPERSVLYQE